MIGTLIAVAFWALAIWLALGLFRASDEDEQNAQIIERRLRDVSRTPDDHPGVVLHFRRRA